MHPLSASSSYNGFQISTVPYYRFYFKAMVFNRPGWLIHFIVYAYCLDYQIIMILGNIYEAWFETLP